MAANGCEKSARAEVAAALIKIALLWENSPTDPLRLRPFVCEMSFVKESAKSRRACPHRQGPGTFQIGQFPALLAPHIVP